MSQTDPVMSDLVADVPPAAGMAHLRRPGETLFMAILAAVSLVLLWSAYTISGFGELSAAGTMPMVFTAVMSVTAIADLVRTIRKKRMSDETVARDILPLTVVAVILLIAGYALLLKPVGFLPTSVVFLFLAISLLSRRGPFFAAWTTLVSVALIYVIFRLVFTVLMPEGIVPEGEIIAAVRNLAGGK